MTSRLKKNDQLPNATAEKYCSRVGYNCQRCGERHLFANQRSWQTLVTGLKIDNLLDGIGLRRSRFFVAGFRCLFEPRRRHLIAERKPQSINKKRIFAKHERTAFSDSSRGDEI